MIVVILHSIAANSNVSLYLELPLTIVDIHSNQYVPSYSVNCYSKYGFYSCFMCTVNWL